MATLHTFALARNRDFISALTNHLLTNLPMVPHDKYIVAWPTQWRNR